MTRVENQGGPGAPSIADLIKTHSSGPSGADNRRFAQGLVFDWLLCGTARLAPFYDLNSHLADTDGSVTDLSMSINGIFRAATITAHDWSDFAPSLHVEDEWLRDEITRQNSEIRGAAVEAVTSIGGGRSMAPTLDRLLVNLRA